MTTITDLAIKATGGRFLASWTNGPTAYHMWLTRRGAPERGMYRKGKNGVVACLDAEASDYGRAALAAIKALVTADALQAAQAVEDAAQAAVRAQYEAAARERGQAEYERLHAAGYRHPTELRLVAALQAFLACPEAAVRLCQQDPAAYQAAIETLALTEGWTS